MSGMDIAGKVQFIRERVVSRRWFQISGFIFVLVLSLGLFSLARTHLDLESLLSYGYLGIFLVNLITTATILFPLPGEAVNVAAASIFDPLWIGLVASVGATIGELTCYAAGYWGRKITMGENSERYKRAKVWLDRYGALAVFLFALLPILIFDLLGLVAGSLRFPLHKFILACWAGRVIRCLLEAYLGWGAFGFLTRLW